MRLHVYMAKSGLASRRKCEEYIRAGRVTVNNIPVTEMGYRVHENDSVSFDGKIIRPVQKKIYIALNKPEFYLCSNSDVYSRKIAADLFSRHIKERLHHAGRLDYRSSGLIFYTNDGLFTRIVTHPSYNVEKEYLVKTSSPVPRELLEEYRKGIVVDRELLQLKEYTLVSRKFVRLILCQGRNREIRKVFKAYNIPLVELKRVRIGIVSIGRIASGSYRNLHEREIRWFLQRNKNETGRKRNK